jgi:hypothetical protein
MFSFQVFCLLFAVGTFTPVFKDNKHSKSHKTVEKEGSGSALIITEPDPEDPKTYGSYGSGYGYGTLRSNSKLSYFDKKMF